MDAESARFFYFAKGSSGELITQIYIAIEIGVINKQNGMVLIKEAKEISAMIVSLILEKAMSGKIPLITKYNLDARTLLRNC